MKALARLIAYDGRPLFEEPPPSFAPEGVYPEETGTGFLGPDDVAR